MMQNDLALRGPLPIEPAGTMELFAERDNRGEMREPLAPGAVLLRGFAASKAAELLAEVQQVTARSPFRLMSARGYPMSVAMSNCGTVGWVTDEMGYRYDSTDPKTAMSWPQPRPKPGSRASCPTPACSAVTCPARGYLSTRTRTSAISSPPSCPSPWACRPCSFSAVSAGPTVRAAYRWRMAMWSYGVARRGYDFTGYCR